MANRLQQAHITAQAMVTDMTQRVNTPEREALQNAAAAFTPVSNAVDTSFQPFCLEHSL